jgi:hypothetical protein
VSVCDPKSPDACEACRLTTLPEPIYVSTPERRDQKELERMLEELKTIRIDARRLTKSGHPGVRAEALRHLANAEDDIRWLKSQLAKEA